MNRHKLLALAAMLLVPLAACDEGTPPVPVGGIDGQVSIEGQGVDGVTVTVSTGATTTTAGGGRFSFANIDGGTYTVAISNYPADASFTSTSQSATIATDGQTATVNFSGTYIRTASIVGSVTVESTGLSGVTVRISGAADQSTQTDANGEYAFAQLRAGTYEVEVSGFGADVGFSSASQSVTVGVGLTETASFDGTYVRTAGISGRVAIEGDGLAGVTVSLTGIEPMTATTDAAGQYAFAELRPGSYTVGISGFDTRDYEFTETSKSVTVALGQTNNVPFDGIRLRTAGISGQVSVEGAGIAGVVVALMGGDAEAMDTTNAEGQYGFSGLAAGTYTVTISGYDDVAYSFAEEEKAKTVDLALGQAAIQNFEGEHMRTAGISGRVTVEGAGIEGVTVTLTARGAPMSAASTDAEGQYAFAELRAGSYTIVISGFNAEEYTFANTFETVTVGLGETGTASFDGTRLRTAGIRGQVSVERAGLAGVVVALSGDDATATDTTDAAGEYAFSGLVSGNYMVTISGYDGVAYSFEEEAKTVELATGETSVQHFKGEHTRTAGISGQVTVEGVGLAGVVVALSGDATATETTDDAGLYAFAELRAGNYTVSIQFNAEEYDFTETSESVTVMPAQTGTVSFEGTRLRTAGIRGRVSVERAGIAGVMVTLSGDATATETTDAAGDYAFSGLVSGNYTVTISGYDGVAYSFEEEAKTVELATGDLAVQHFEGEHTRTAGISGQVTVEGAGLAGVVVALSGDATATETTDDEGRYAFAELRAGNYTVSIQFNAEEYDFTETSESVTVMPAQMGTASFDGTRLRTAGIRGQVSVERVGIEGVVVALSGAAEAMMDTTDAAGEYAFSGLVSGTYMVTISGYDAVAYSFEEEAKTVELATGDLAVQHFKGEHTRTAGISGQVTVEGAEIAGVVITLTGAPELLAMMDTTDAEGRYAFAELRAGNYTVSIQEFNTEEHAFAKTSESVTVAPAQMGTVSFEGTRLRTAGIRGQVSVGDAGIAGVVVELTGAAEMMDTTNAAGEYAFSGLVAGTYTVTITEYDKVAYSFEEEAKTVGVELATGETSVQHFEGEHTRTAGISGEVTVEGAGIAGVVVELTGAAEMMDTTGAAGDYAFSGLVAGNYTVSIQGFNAEKYAFTQISESVTVMPNQMSTVSFEGTRLRTAGISGQVGVDGDGIEGVTVALSGDAEAMDTTDLTGQYAFTGLAGGTYMVTISGYDDAAYMFEETEKTVELVDDEAATQHFEGAHTMTASISGQAFLDANEDDALDADDEDPLMVAGMAITLLGPGVTDVNNVTTDSTGMFMFDSLRAGTYRVLMTTGARDPKVLTALGVPEGVVFDGNAAEGYPVTIGPGGTMIRNLPFNITLQTLTMKAMMGDGDGNTGEMVEGVGIDLYPTYASANAGRSEIGNTVMTDATGTATFKFERALDTSPGGGRDYVVFAKVAKLPHADLVATADSVLEITYSARSPIGAAEKAVQMLNRRAVFQFQVRNIETKVGGNKPQPGWISEIRTAVGNDGFQSPKKASDDNGMTTFSDFIDAGDLPTKYYIRLAPSQGPLTVMGEAFMGTPEPSDDAALKLLKVGSSKTAKAEPLLVYEHDGLVMPGKTTDLGVLRVKFITQTLVVGVHYERTQVSGYDENIVDGDRRPSAMGAAAIDVALQTRDQYGTPQDWEYPQGAKPTGGTANPRSPKAVNTTDAGLVSFYDLPANTEFIVKASTSNPRKIYGASEVDAFLGSPREQTSRGDHSSGAFGKESGTGPKVSLCPLAQSGDRADCSTFGYGFTNGRVDVSVASRDYDGPGGNPPVTVFSSGGKDSVTVMLTPLKTLGRKSYPPATANGKSCTEESGGAPCTGGTLSFKNVEGGRYELSIMSNSGWDGRVSGSTLRADTITLFSLEDTDGTDQHSDDNKFQVTYLKTQIKGTVANDLDNSTLGQGNGIVHNRETREGATLTISSVSSNGRSFTPVATVKTGSDGTFTSPYLREGRYVVTGQSTDEYELRANNVNPTNRTGFLTTTALASGRIIDGGTIGTAGDLPRWSYGDHDGLADGVRSDVALAVLDVQADADFIVLFKDGQLAGRVTQPDDFGKAANARDSDTDPDPYAGITVNLERCGDIGIQSTALNGFRTSLGYDNCRLAGNVDESFERKSTTTNSAGVYTFTGLKEGWYSASLDLTGVNYSPSAPTHLISYIRLLQGPGDSDTFFTMHVQRN